MLISDCRTLGSYCRKSVGAGALMMLLVVGGYDIFTEAVQASAALGHHRARPLGEGLEAGMRPWDPGFWANLEAGDSWMIQVGLFENALDAYTMQRALMHLGYAAYTPQATEADFFQVLIGPLAAREDADKLYDILQALALEPMILPFDPWMI